MAVLQAFMLLLPGRGKVVVARWYWASLCRLMGMQVRVIGTPARRLDGRPVVFASNHSSWLDVLTLGGTLEACFIAKQEVGGWPLRQHHRAAGPDGVRQPPGQQHRPRA